MLARNFEKGDFCGILMRMETKNQGVNASKLFHGISDLSSTHLLYSESAELFASIIKKHFPEGEYTFADLGGHKGDFFVDLINKLQGYKLKAYAIDVNENDLSSHPADNKVLANVSNTSLPEKTIDISIARYVVAWNSKEKQKRIIQEIARITKGIALIQHQGADKDNAGPLQTATNELFSGIVPELKRDEFYFSTTLEIEEWAKEFGIKFEILQERKIEKLSDVLIEKYGLSDEKAQKVKDILAGVDYVVQSTFLFNFSR